MKHVFIINPTAGKRDATVELMEMAKGLQARHGLEVECILTKRAGPRRRDRPLHGPDRGGPAVLCLRRRRHHQRGGQRDHRPPQRRHDLRPPWAPANDFLKNFGDAAPLFSDPENLFDGPQFPLDAIECNGRAALTIACSGFDAQVAHDVHPLRPEPPPGQPQQLYRLPGGELPPPGPGPHLDRHPGRPVLDRLLRPGLRVQRPVLRRGLHAVAEARMDDGVLNTMVVKKVSRLDFLKFVGAYATAATTASPQYARCYTCPGGRHRVPRPGHRPPAWTGSPSSAAGWSCGWPRGR